VAEALPAARSAPRDHALLELLESSHNTGDIIREKRRRRSRSLARFRRCRDRAGLENAFLSFCPLHLALTLFLFFVFFFVFVSHRLCT
jgi:hypothetical protein